jgi:hypothetical protein
VQQKKKIGAICLGELAAEFGPTGVEVFGQTRQQDLFGVAGNVPPQLHLEPTPATDRLSGI